MLTTRVTPKRAPVSPGRESRFTVRKNRNQNDAWWIHYEQGPDLILADEPHTHLVNLVNFLKQSEGVRPGGGFSITEHSQVIARMKPVAGYENQQAIHVVGIANGDVVTWPDVITFQGGALNPTVTPNEGEEWPGPLCGTSYTFAARNAPHAPSHNLDEIWLDVNGVEVQLSAQCGISPYPPTTGALADFLFALRRQLHPGGRFRVNEHGRAFTSDTNRFIGSVPKTWFKPISPLD